MTVLPHDGSLHKYSISPFVLSANRTQNIKEISDTHTIDIEISSEEISLTEYELQQENEEKPDSEGKIPQSDLGHLTPSIDNLTQPVETVTHQEDNITQEPPPTSQP